MSGFVVVIDKREPITAENPVFVDFLESVTSYKCLDKPEQFATGTSCVAAKLDSASTLHKGIVVDSPSGSWLLAVGTVIDNAAIHPDGDLHQLLRDYLQHGDKVFERLDGHFALVIYNGPEDNLVVVSDPLGLISIYYGQKENQVFVSTSALAVAKAIQSKPSPFGIRYFILYGNILGETTIWQDVKRVLPATVIQLTRTGIKKHSYWTFQLNQTIKNLSLDETVDCVIDVLTRITRQALEREGKVWLSLTGGFDSRTLAALVNHVKIPFKSYTHGQPDAKDVRIASLISQKMGWDHEYFPLPANWGYERSSWLAQTLGSSDSHLEVFKTSRILREQALKSKEYGVSLWGFGGELYRGYHWKQEFFNTGIRSKVNYDRLLDYRILPTVDWPILKDSSNWIRMSREELKTQLRATGEQEPDWLNTVKLDLIGNYMEHSWSGAHISAVLGLQRVIAPFCFKEGVTCTLSVNHRWRVQGRLFRLMLERLSSTLANIETADGGPALPMRLTNAYKFIPYWLGISEKLIWGVSRKVVGRNLWRKTDAGPMGNAYPAAQWRQDTLSQLDKFLLTPGKMHSACLYDNEILQKFITQAQTNNFSHEALLGRIVTIEMALQSVGVSL